MKEYASYYAGIKREDKVPVRQGRKPAPFQDVQF